MAALSSDGRKRSNIKAAAKQEQEKAGTLLLFVEASEVAWRARTLALAALRPSSSSSSPSLTLKSRV
jgi:hypothetical protein